MSNLRYRIRYERLGESGATMPFTKDVYGVSAISALNCFHRDMQLTKEIADDKKTVMRDKLKPDEYSVTQICLLYNSDASGKCRGEWVESPFDLPPNSKNPDLWKKEEPKQNDAFAFMAEIQDGRLAE
jgi:hypothetical protein